MADKEVSQLKKGFNAVLHLFMFTVIVVSIPFTLQVMAETSTSTHNISDARFEEMLKETICMDKLNYPQTDSSKGLWLSELDTDRSELRAFVYMTEDKGFSEIRRGLFTGDAWETEKYYDRLQKLDEDYCRGILDYESEVNN